MKEKVIAAFMTTITLLSTFGSALAAVTLGDYPTFLFTNHNLNAYVVVGAAAQPADVVGAVDLAARLAGESYQEVSSSGGGVTVTGGKSDDIPIGKAITESGYLDQTFTIDQLAGLQKGEITFAGDSYNVEDEIYLIGTSPTVCASLNCSDDDYKTGVYMEVATGALRYYYIFDEAMNVSTATSSDPVQINFLGKTLKITSTSSATKFTAYVGTVYSMNVGDSVTVEGKTVTLKNVGSNGAVMLDIAGTAYTISGTQTKAGIEITIDDYFYSDTLSERAATLVMGKESISSYQNGDVYLKQDNICNDDPNDTDCWVWMVSGLTSNTATSGTPPSSGPILGIESAWVINNYDDNPITVGGCYKYPNDYAEVCMNSLTVPDDNYETVTVKIQDGINFAACNAGLTNQQGLLIESNVADGLQLESDAWTGGYITTDTRTEKIWLTLNTTNSTHNVLNAMYISSDGSKACAGIMLATNTNTNFGRVYYAETKDDNVNLYLKGAMTAADDTNITLDIAGKTATDLPSQYDDIVIQIGHAVNATFSRIGTTASTEEAGELKWCGTKGACALPGTGWTNIGTKEDDERSMYGIIIQDPKANGASDQEIFKIPSDQVFATVIVKGPSTTVSSTTGSTVKNVVPVTTAVAKLDTEITDPATVGKDLVLVGGPAVNTLTAQAMGLTYPTYGSSGLLPITQGQGYIKVFDGVFVAGQQVVVVFGWDATDTRNACSVLQEYSSFATQFDTNVAVKVTSVSASGITAA
jgi:hypothetical protein